MHLQFEKIPNVAKRKQGVVHYQIISLEGQTSILHTLPQYAQLRRICSSMLAQVSEANETHPVRFLIYGSLPAVPSRSVTYGNYEVLVRS